MSISVFFPCYNDKHTIAGLVETAFATLKKLTRDYEVIVVDDGSTDGSRKLLQKLKRKYKKLKLVFHPRNLGYGQALQSGFGAATKKLIFYTDGDGQYDPRELAILTKLMTDDVSFVQGVKMDRQDYSYRIVIGNLYEFVARWLFLLPTYDVDCDFRLIRSSIVDKLDLHCCSGAVCVELVKKAELVGAKFRHVEIHHYARGYGRSQFFRLDRIWQTAAELLPLWWEVMVEKSIA